MIHLRPQHVRTRLTLWYLGVLAGVLLLYVVCTSVFCFFNFRRELDQSAIQDIENVESLLSFGPDGALRLGLGSTDDEHEAEQNHLIEVRDLNGGVLFRNKRLGDASLGGSPAQGEGKDG